MGSILKIKQVVVLLLSVCGLVWAVPSISQTFNLSPQMQKEWKQNANAGDAEAQFNMGTSYYYDMGLYPVDYAKALQWFEKSASQNYSKSQNMIGLMYWLGNGLEHNSESSFEWYLKAAKNGHVPSQYLVGRMYLNGLGTSSNVQKARN